MVKELYREITVKLYSCKECNKTMMLEVFSDEATTVEIMKQNPTCNDCEDNNKKE